MKCSTILLSFHSNTCTNVLILKRITRYALSCVPICVACCRTTYFSRSREYSFEKNKTPSQIEQQQQQPSRAALLAAARSGSDVSRIFSGASSRQQQRWRFRLDGRCPADRQQQQSQQQQQQPSRAALLAAAQSGPTSPESSPALPPANNSDGGFASTVVAALGDQT
jgi:hypothetical protein